MLWSWFVIRFQVLLLFNGGHFQVLTQCSESLTRSCLICIPSLVFRVERLWRDVWSVTCQYYDVLHSLEEEGFIDLSIAVHLFCVGYVFIPRLRSDLQLFTESWNCHPLRTEGNLTPNQLWMIGMLQAPVPEPDLVEVCIRSYETNVVANDTYEY